MDDATDNGYDIGAGAGSRAPTLETSMDGKYAVRVGGSSQKYLRSAETSLNLGCGFPAAVHRHGVIKINRSAYLWMATLGQIRDWDDNGDNIDFSNDELRGAGRWRS